MLGETPPVHGNHENDLSISLLVQYDGFRYFIGGDIEETTEDKIESRDLVVDVDVDVDVYQANHHGSHTSSSLEFVRDLHPSAVIISNGNHGGFQHPRQTTLTNLESLTPQPMVFQTNKYLKGGAGGNVPDEFIGDLESSGTDGTILITVDSLSRQYTITYRDSLSHTVNIKSSPEASMDIVIESLLPNPVGSDRENEAVTLRNDGSTPVNLSGWVLRDDINRVWTLSSLGNLGTGQSATVVRNGMPMSLNNGGDTITLIDADNVERDRFQYQGSSEGVPIPTGH